MQACQLLAPLTRGGLHLGTEGRDLGPRVEIAVALDNRRRLLALLEAHPRQACLRGQLVIGLFQNGRHLVGALDLFTDNDREIGDVTDCEGSPDRVVRENSKLPVQNATWTQSADRSGHTIAALGIEAGLGTVGNSRILHRLRRGGG